MSTIKNIDPIEPSEPSELDEGNDGGDSADTSAARYNVPALERGLRILGEFGRDRRSLSAPELARRLNLPRSTVFRLLNTLETMGFIERRSDSGDYRLGMAVLRLGFEYLSSLELTELGQPVLSRLCDETGCPCNLVVRDHRSIVYVGKVVPPRPLVSSVKVGTRLPAHATVLGRLLLADLTLPELRALYPEDGLQASSKQTPKSVLDLFDLVQADRLRGYAVGLGFYEPSISTVAAPVFDQSNRIVAAMGITFYGGQVSQERLAEVVAPVRNAAAELSRLLNHRPPSHRGDNVITLAKA